MEVFQIQEAVSRPASVRQRLANAAWGTGTSAFIANGVPFSFTTGPALAERVCGLITFLAGDRTLTLHDVGAGTGYLTRHVVEALLRTDPVLAQECRYVASDSSEAMVEAMGDVFSGLPDAVRNRIDLRVEDALAPEALAGDGPSILLMSYLIDAIPPVHAMVSDEGVREVLVETYLAADTRVVDASVLPARILEGEELVEVLRDAPESLGPGAALQILPRLMESGVEGDLLEDPRLAAPLLNVRSDFCEAIRDVVTRLEDESIILVTDFGYSEMAVPEDFDELMTEYGLTTCYAVFFEEVMNAAVAGGATCRLLSGAPGGTHTLGIYKGSRMDEFEARFASVFDQQASERDVSFELTQTTCLEDVVAIEQQIISDGLEQASYAHLANLAHLFAKHGDAELSRTYATSCDNRYGLIAAPEQLLLGDLAMSSGNEGEALRWYERARQTAPTYGSVHVKAAEVYLAQGKVDRYADAMRAYVGVTDEAVSAHLTWLTTESRDAVPEDVRDEFDQIREEELGWRAD